MTIVICNYAPIVDIYTPRIIIYDVYRTDVTYDRTLQAMV